MSVARSVYYLMLADFLERIRRYSFLVVLAAAVVMGYSLVPAVDDPYDAFLIGGYRGIYNSAWIGMVFGTVASTLLTLLGFFLVRKSVTRDYETRVGQIIATTPVTRTAYVVGKWFSNLAVFSLILVVLTVMAFVMLLVRGESSGIDLWALVAPIWLVGLPALAVVAAVALLFENVSFLRGGVGAVAYLALWLWLLITSVGGMFESVAEIEPSNDIAGLSHIMVDIRTTMVSEGLDPDSGITDLYQPRYGQEVTRFTWNGMEWSVGVVAERVSWVGLALIIALVSALPFDRFDPARTTTVVRQRKKRRPKKLGLFSRLGGRGDPPSLATEYPGSVPVDTAVLMEPLQDRRRHGRFFSIVVAEFRILIRGRQWWWWLGAVAIMICNLAVPERYFSGLFLPLVWLWPIFVWPAMGHQEHANQVNTLVFPTANLIRRQFPAAWLAGVLVICALGSTAAARLLVAGQELQFAGFFVGAIFVPTLALALGVWTSGGRTFETLYAAIWLVGVFGRLWPLDFLGRTEVSIGYGIPLYYLLFSGLLLFFAAAGRRVRTSGV